MDKALEVRALRADEIECRVQQCTEKGVILLLYKDARCDMSVLDEIFTPYGWQRKHELINGKEFCTVSVRSNTGEWISKQDCGSESNAEKVKGETSDAFKRACVNWGIGRELYTKIFIFAKVPTQKNGAKYEMTDKYAKFTVSKIETDNKAKKILHIEIIDKNGKRVFKWDKDNPPQCESEESEAGTGDESVNSSAAPPNAESKNNDKPPEKQNQNNIPAKQLSEKQIRRLHAIRKSVNIDEDTLKKIMMKHYKKSAPEELTRAEYDFICKNLEETQNKNKNAQAINAEASA